jgi:hypothetical protein
MSTQLLSSQRAGLGSVVVTDPGTGATQLVPQVGTVTSVLAAVAWNASANLAGAGSLTAQANTIRWAVATFAGDSALTAQAGIGVGSAAIFAGVGALTANPSQASTWQISATFAGDSALQAQANVGKFICARFAGAGALAALTQGTTNDIAADWAGLGALVVNLNLVPHQPFDASLARIITGRFGSSGVCVRGVNFSPSGATKHSTLQLVPGDHWLFQWLCFEADGAPMDLTGARYRWKLGTAPNLSDVMAFNAGFYSDNEVHNAVNFIVPPIDTATVPPGYFWDSFVVTQADGTVSTQAIGRIQALSP